MTTPFQPSASMQKLLHYIRTDPILGERYRKLHGIDPPPPSALPAVTQCDAALWHATKRDEMLPRAESAAPARDAVLRHVTPGDPTLPDSRNGKTNPFKVVTPRQLAAARLFAAGRTVSDVVAELRISRQTLWRWRKHPGFTVALASVHRDLCRNL